MVSIAEQHPELFHYTGISGLEGVLKNQTLWATHAAFSNDASELIAFKKRLPSIIGPEVKSGVAELIRQAPENQKLVDERGGLEATIDEVNAGIVTGIFESLFGTEGIASFAEPYIVSFCTASGEVAEHGLLSQWRAYGRQGGYAIVLDTAELDKLLTVEGSMWHLDLFGGDVIYSHATDEQIREELGADIEVIKRSIGCWLSSAGREECLEEIYYSLVRCACRYKHWGFHEEREVRIVAIPPNAETLAALTAKGSAIKAKPLHHFARGSSSIPTIHLFEGVTSIPGRALPIRRIIVGPGSDRRKRKLGIVRLLKELNLDVVVSTSDIPYVE